MPLSLWKKGQLKIDSKLGGCRARNSFALHFSLFSGFSLKKMVYYKVEQKNAMRKGIIFSLVLMLVLTQLGLFTIYRCVQSAVSEDKCDLSSYHAMRDSLMLDFALPESSLCAPQEYRVKPKPACCKVDSRHDYVAVNNPDYNGFHYPGYVSYTINDAREETRQFLFVNKLPNIPKFPPFLDSIQLNC